MPSLQSIALILTLSITGSGFADATHDPLRAVESVAGKHAVLDASSSVPPTGSYTAPDGTVWGPVARTVSGGIRNMTQYQAVEYCASQGLSLPTRAQFDTLRSQLGYPNNYNPAPVPDLNGNYFWSSSVYRDYSYYAYYFVGRYGYIGSGFRGSSGDVAVRCVGVRR